MGISYGVIYPKDYSFRPRSKDFALIIDLLVKRQVLEPRDNIQQSDRANWAAGPNASALFEYVSAGEPISVQKYDQPMIMIYADWETFCPGCGVVHDEEKSRRYQWWMSLARPLHRSHFAVKMWDTHHDGSTPSWRQRGEARLYSILCQRARNAYPLNKRPGLMDKDSWMALAESWAKTGREPTFTCRDCGKVFPISEVQYDGPRQGFGWMSIRAEGSPRVDGPLWAELEEALQTPLVGTIFKM